MRLRPVHHAPRLLTVLAVVACSAGSSDRDEDGSATPVVLNGPETVYGLPNMDNDGKDWSDEDPDDDELVLFRIVPSDIQAASFRLTLSDSESARIWHDDDILLTDEEPEAELTRQSEPLELMVEFRDFDVDAMLTVEELDDEGEPLRAVDVELRSSPLFLNHHLQSAELVVATSVSFRGFDNDAFIEEFVDALGDRFEAASGRAYGQDVWMQDEIEFAYGILPDGQTLDLVIDSIRDRGLDDYPEDIWAGEQFGVKTWGRGYATSQDSFGNLENSPPIDGFPFGRIYYGASGGYYRPWADELFEVLEENRIQQPFEVDISWLCVGHVDEFMTFVPDSTAPRGFRFVINDVAAAYDVLDQMDPSTPLPRYEGRQNHNYSTVGELVADQGLRLHNEDLQLDHIDPILDQMIAELGLLDEEIIFLPGLFEVVGGYCGNTNAALIPGMANLTVADVGDGTELFIADPFLRADLDDQSSDPMIQAVRDILPAEAKLHFLDDWETYHLALGEVHCGSNVLRTPSSTDWWTQDLGGSK